MDEIIKKEGEVNYTGGSINGQHQHCVEPKDNHDNSVDTSVSMFPMAGALNAKSLTEVFEGWKQKGLTPVEMTEEDFRQSISIIFNSFDGNITWKGDNVYGLHMLALMADTMKSMVDYFLKDPARPKMYPGDCQIHVALKDNRMGIVFDRNNDPQLLKGILVAALWHVIEQFHKPGDCNPFNEFMGCFEFEND